MRALKISILFLVTCFALSPLIVLAAPDATAPLADDEFKDKMTQLEEEVGILKGFFVGLAASLFEISGINSISSLVFGNPIAIWSDGQYTDDSMYGIFPKGTVENVISPIGSIFVGSYVLFIMIAIMVATLKLGFKAYSPQAKSMFWTDVQMWVMSAFFMATFPLIVGTMFELNQAFVMTIADTFTSVSQYQATSIIATAGELKFSDIFVVLAEWGLALYLNMIYIARTFVLLFLMILGPVAAISLLYPKTRSFFGTYLKEFAGNVFLPSIHAIALFVFINFADTIGAGTIFKLGTIIMFIPVTSMLTRWLGIGDSSTMMGKALGAAGMGAIAGGFMVARQGANIMRGAGKGANPSSAEGSGGGASVGGNSEPGAISEKASGRSSKIWQAAKAVGGVAGAAAGAAAGLAFGPMGVAVGGYLGSKGARGVMQGSRQLASGMGSVAKTVGGTMRGGSFRDAISGRSTLAHLSNPSNNRQFMGAMGESIGSIAGMGGAGRKIGQAMSGVSNQSISPGSLESIARENPGANMRWVQDQQASTFQIQQGTGQDGNAVWSNVGVPGAGDATLQHGQTRTIDYQLNDGNEWKRMDNGSYIGQGSSSTQGSPDSGARGSGTQIVGMSGSTENIARTSGVYITDQHGGRVEDTTFNARNVNPNNYFTPLRTKTDAAADFVANPRKGYDQLKDNVNAWKTGYQRQQATQRSRHHNIV